MNTTVFSVSAANTFSTLLQDHGSRAALLCDQTALSQWLMMRRGSKHSLPAEPLLLPTRGSCTLEEADRLTLEAGRETVDFLLAAGDKETCALGRIVAEWLEVPVFLLPIGGYDPETPSVLLADEYGNAAERYFFEDTPVAVVTDFFRSEGLCRAAGC